MKRIEHWSPATVAIFCLFVVLFVIAATACQPRVIVGELQNISVDVSPGQRLDVKMWPRAIDGESVWVRCDHMGGFYVQSTETCIGVDF